YTSRQRHLRNLVVMAIADGSIGQREVNLIADRCVQLGLGQADLEAALQAGLSDDAALELPVDANDRVACLQDLIRMMAADGVLDESEKRLFALAAARMNIGGDELTQIIASVLPSQHKTSGDLG
ncbi:MAG: TerB family tellurite resistance protein, partial [Planctomycetota bacterium]